MDLPAKRYDPGTGWTTEIKNLGGGRGKRIFSVPTEDEVQKFYDAQAMGAGDNAERGRVRRERPGAMSRRKQLQVSVMKGDTQRPGDQTIRIDQLTPAEKTTAGGYEMATTRNASLASAPQMNNALQPNTVIATVTSKPNPALRKIASVPPSMVPVYAPPEKGEHGLSVTPCPQCCALVSENVVDVHERWHEYENLRVDRLIARIEALEQRAMTGRSMVKRPRPKGTKS